MQLKLLSMAPFIIAIALATVLKLSVSATSKLNLTRKQARLYSDASVVKNKQKKGNT